MYVGSVEIHSRVVTLAEKMTSMDESGERHPQRRLTLTHKVVKTLSLFLADHENRNLYPERHASKDKTEPMKD